MTAFGAAYTVVELEGAAGSAELAEALAFRSELARLTGRTSVPSIWIGGKFVGGYISGKYFFDIHPPFGKLLLALAGRLAGYAATQPFISIGELLEPATPVFALRFVPALFGT